MNKHDKRRGDNDRPPDDLTRLLRDADPAGDRAELDGVERASMRAAIVAAADESRGTQLGSRQHASWVAPALAVAVVLVVALGLWLRTGPAAFQPATVADVDVPPANGGSAPATDSGSGDSLPPASAGMSGGRPAPPLPDAPTMPDPTPLIADVAATASSDDDSPATENASASSNEPKRTARTVRFTAPRGTRIIWTLDPDFESPISGQDAQQEDSK